MGFNLAGVPGGSLGVRSVVPGSSADKVGLKEGDQLVEFDGSRGATCDSSDGKRQFETDEGVSTFALSNPFRES